MRVNQSGQDRRLTEINDSSPRGNCDGAFRADVRDSLTVNKHNLFGQHLAAEAVEHSACANRDICRSRWARIYSAPGKHTWGNGAYASPSTRLDLRSRRFWCMA